MCRVGVGSGLAAIDVSEGLTVGIEHLEAAGDLLDHHGGGKRGVGSAMCRPTEPC